MHGEELIAELERINGKPLTSEEGAIFIDYAAYFPFPNKDLVSLDVTLLETFELEVKNIFTSKDIVCNYRYKNRRLITLTKTAGSKRCKFGTFIVNTRESLNKTRYIAFQICLDGLASYVGIFPVHMNLTEECPYANISCSSGALTSEANFNHFLLATLKPVAEGSWTPYYYYTSTEIYETMKEEPLPNSTLLQKKSGYHVIDGINYIITIYNTPIILYSSNKEMLGVP